MHFENLNSFKHLKIGLCVFWFLKHMSKFAGKDCDRARVRFMASIDLGTKKAHKHKLFENFIFRFVTNIENLQIS